MLELLARQRLTIDANFISIDEIATQPLRASCWEFALKWDELDIPLSLKISGVILKHWKVEERADTGSCLFLLPPMVRGLTRIEVETTQQQKFIKILDVIPGYQLPQQHLRELIEWIETFYGQISLFPNQLGDISVLNMIADEMFKHFSHEQTNLPEEDIPPEKRNELTSLFEEVLKAPHRRLIDDNILVAPGEIQRITPNTIDYFIRHPETWHTRNYFRPRPIRLLDERAIENFDVYENRFVLHFLEQLDILLGHLIHRYKLVVDELKLKIPESEIRANFGWITHDQDVIERLHAQKIKVQSDLLGLKRLKDDIRRVQTVPMFADVARLNRPPRANTTLSMHPVYGRLYQLYEEIIGQKFDQQKMSWLEKAKQADLLSTYQLYSFLMVKRALEETRFELRDSNNPSPSIFSNNLVTPLRNTLSDENWQLNFVHNQYSQATIKVTYLDSRQEQFLRGTIRLEFELISKLGQSLPSIKKEDVWLIPDTTWWGGTKGEVEAIDREEKRSSLHELYGQLHSISAFLRTNNNNKPQKKRKRVAIQDDPDSSSPLLTVLLLHPTPPADFDDRFDYYDLRLLLNQGDNFVTNEDYQAFGGYNMGCLPLYPSGEAEFRNLLRLMRLIRIHLFRLGVEDLCWNCFRKQTSYKEENGQRHYECLNSGCRLRWGEVECRKCHHRYIKMKRPGTTVKKRDVSLETANSAREVIANSEALEGRLTVSSVCENIDQVDNFWAICPYCGHCEKATGSSKCWRCMARQE